MSSRSLVSGDRFGQAKGSAFKENYGFRYGYAVPGLREMVIDRQEIYIVTWMVNGIPHVWPPVILLVRHGNRITRGNTTELAVGGPTGRRCISQAIEKQHAVP
jgi:hypothetical protein